MAFLARLVFLIAGCLAGSQGFFLRAANLVIDGDLHHLRIEGPREWSEFTETPEAGHLEIRFEARENRSAQALRLRQQDVKQAWRVLLNGRELGRLPSDEDDMVVYFPVPAGALRSGENVLLVEQDLSRRSTPDDVRVGEVALDDRSVDEALSEATVEIKVIDEDTGRPGRRLSVRRAFAARPRG